MAWPQKYSWMGCFRIFFGRIAHSLQQQASEINKFISALCRLFIQEHISIPAQQTEADD